MATSKSDLLRARARSLRAASTDAERRLWYLLRAHRTQGWKFRRQHPIGPYIVDFVCFEHQLVVEVDGSQHLDAAAYDEQRDCFLRTRGLLVLRFWDNDVLCATASVLEAIRAATLRQPPSPPPLSR